jgi:hypothetical protein
MRLWATAAFVSFSFRKRGSSAPNNELRRPVGIVNRLEGGVLTMAAEMSLAEDTEMAEDIWVTKEVARCCSDKFTVGLMTDVELTFSTSVAAGTAMYEKRLTR